MGMKDDDFVFIFSDSFRSAVCKALIDSIGNINAGDYVMQREGPSLILMIFKDGELEKISAEDIYSGQ
jgi:hypothetical protein